LRRNRRLSCVSMEIETFRTRLERFEEDLNRQLYQFYSGKSDRLSVIGLYSDYSDFFSRDRIRELETELEKTSELFSSRRKSLERILGFLIDQHLDSRLARLTEEIDSFEAKRTFVWEGKDISLEQISRYLGSEPESSKRRKLSEKHVGQLAESLRREAVLILRSAAVDLGFPSYAEARERVCGYSFQKLLDDLDAALRPLDDTYLEGFRSSMESVLGIPYQEAGSWDVLHWEKKSDFGQVFSKDKMLPVVQATVSELGIEPERKDSVLFDLEFQEGKRAAPLCIPIRIPHEIKIVMQHRDGSRHYGALFHEIGHAYHFAWTSPSLPVEHRAFGDRAVSESYAFLLEHFLRDRAWLTRMLSFWKSEEFLRFQSVLRVFLIRRCAGKLRFALRLYSQEALENMPQKYAEVMRASTGISYQPEFWLFDLAEAFYSADHLRGWIFEAMLREYLRSRFGNSWIMSRTAAGFLKEIWETGQLYRADELCREIGIGDLDAQVLADELAEGLRL
jgi:hypothetical protein